MVVGEIFHIKSRGQVIHLPDTDLPIDSVLERRDSLRWRVIGRERQGYRMSHYYLVKPINEMSLVIGKDVLQVTADLSPGDVLELVK